MNKFLEAPVVLHWDMRQTLKSKRAIEKKIRQMPFAKIRLLYPETCEDWEFVKHIIVSKNNTSKFQIEFGLEKCQFTQTFLDKAIGNIELLPVYTQECNDLDIYSVLKDLDKNYNMLHVGFYLNEDNADKYIEILEKIHQNRNYNFCIKLDKENYNPLYKSYKLHSVIEKVSELYVKYPEIKLSFYDEEKIIKDIFDLPYYYYGNIFIDRNDMVSLYSFLPAYDYGLVDTDITFQATWKALISEHACDLEKIWEYPRYWLKRRMEFKNESLFYRDI